MARRPLNDDQRASVLALQKAAAAERVAVQEARAKAEEMIERTVRESREATNAILYSARHTHKVSVTSLTEVGFGNTNRLNVQKRLAEHEKRFGGNVIEAVEVAETAQSTMGLSVTVAGNEVHVILTNYTHPDIGTDVSGEVVYSTDGAELALLGDVQDKASSNPLFTFVLWGLPEVQALI